MGAWLPPVDIAEGRYRILIAAELPGFQQDQSEINLEGNVLAIRGERKFEEEKDGRNYHRVERAYGNFIRSFTLPNNIDRENVQATFRDGILEISLPKREEAKPRQIRITPRGDRRAESRRPEESRRVEEASRRPEKDKQPIEVQAR